MLAGRNHYYYNLAHLGVPHSIAPAQQTEPFWSQFNHVTQTSVPGVLPPSIGYSQYN